MRHIFPWGNHDDNSTSKYLIFNGHISDWSFSHETKILSFQFFMESVQFRKMATGIFSYLSFN